jgi:WD40 repeat protein
VTAVGFGRGGQPLVESRPVSSVAYAPATGAVARGRFDGSIVITHGHVLRAGRDRITALAFSDDGAVLFSGDATGLIRRWDVRTGRPGASARQRLAITSLVVGAGGRQVLSASRDGEARLWSQAKLRPLGKGLRWHFGPIGSAAFSTDGRWIVTAGPTAASVGSAAKRRLLLRLRSGSTLPLVGAAFAGPDHRLIVTAGRDGQIRYYRCEICGGLDDLLLLAKRRLGAL